MKRPLLIIALPAALVGCGNPSSAPPPSLDAAKSAQTLQSSPSLPEGARQAIDAHRAATR